MRAIWPKIAAADAALNELLTEPQCTRIVESIISKYLAMTPSELEEWQVPSIGAATALANGTASAVLVPNFAASQ